MNMSSESARTKTQISRRSMTRSLHTLNVESVRFLEDTEDACTQTCTCAATPAHETPDTDSAYEEIIDSDVTDMSFYETSTFSWSPAQRTRSQFKDKTPKTLKMLKEIHRENERLRHHSLNQHLRLICRKVPGSAENGKETKVVMMQRIISYVAYLENTIRFMCTELQVEPNPVWLKVTSSLHDMDKSETWRKECLTVHSEDSRDSEVFSRNISRRLTLSSPTIDSTTDSAFQFKRPKPRTQPSQESQDSSAPSSSLSVDEDSTDAWQWIMAAETVVIDGSENFDTFLNNTDSETNIFELPHPTFEGQLMKSQEEVKWLASPDRSPSRLQEKLDDHFGIKCDSKYFDEQPGDLMHTFSVSPDEVIPQPTVKEEVVEENEVIADAFSRNTFVTKGNGRFEQAGTRRAPLLNITNCFEVPYNLDKDLFDSPVRICKQDDAGSSVEANSCTQADFNFRMNAVVKTEMRPETSDVAVHEDTEHERTKQRPCEELNKVDFRKSSWMNGFMMYSHIHRKQLIREKPGLHASVVSKLLGHMWRGMTSEQQQPYREQARLCSQELQKRLCKSSR